MIDISGENVVLVGALLLFVAVMAGKVAYRFGAPALLLFLGVGMLFGLNFISFRSVEMTQFVGMIALCIILFTGGMETKYSEIRPVAGPGVVLATVGGTPKSSTMPPSEMGSAATLNDISTCARKSPTIGAQDRLCAGSCATRRTRRRPDQSRPKRSVRPSAALRIAQSISAMTASASRGGTGLGARPRSASRRPA